MSRIKLTFTREELATLRHAAWSEYSKQYGRWMSRRLTHEEFKRIHDRLSPLLNRLDNATLMLEEARDAELTEQARKNIELYGFPVAPLPADRG